MAGQASCLSADSEAVGKKALRRKSDGPEACPAKSTRRDAVD